MSVPTEVIFNDGSIVPKLAYGTATVLYQEECPAYILQALRAGFRHIDTAEHYENEDSVGSALGKWGGKREDVFITTKFGRPWEDAENDPRRSLQNSLNKMGVDSVELFLIHDPEWIRPFTLEETWSTMEQLVSEGFCKSIGISCCKAEHIERLSKMWKIKPVVNQVECSPYCAWDEEHQDLKAACEKHDIAVSPFGAMTSLYASKDGPVDPVVTEIASGRGLSETKVLLLWAAQTCDGPVVTTSRAQERTKEYLTIFDLPPLSDEDIEKISKAGKGRHYRQWT